MMARSRIACVVLVVACGCAEKSDRQPLPLAVVETSSGRIVERWEAPALLFDVKEDPATGRVWAMAETSVHIGPEGSEGARVWELFPDAPPVEHYQLPPVAGGLLTVSKFYWRDFGHIAIDPIARRGLFAAPGSRFVALLDLDTGNLVSGQWGGYLWHGTTFDVEGRIGYASTNELAYAFRTSDGEYQAQELCPQMTSSHAVFFSQANRKLYIMGWLHSLCIYDPVLGTATGPLQAECGGDELCDSVGITVSSDGRRLYVANPSFGPDSLGSRTISALVIWDLVTGVQRVIEDPIAPHGFALSPDDSTLYVTEHICNRIRVYDAISGAFRYDIPTDGETLGIDLSADGTRLYVAQARANDRMGRGKSFWESSLEGEAPPCPPLVLKEP